MSDLRGYAIAMVLLGVVGVASMLLYLAVYRYLTPELIPLLGHRRRVASWRRKAPSVLLLSTATAGVGLAVLAL